jgi:DNA-binding XRE family transcriptional regulator
MGNRARADIRERFGFAVTDRRAARGRAQEEFAARAGIHRTCLSDIEQGTRHVRLVNVKRVASVLSLKIWDLFRLAE